MAATIASSAYAKCFELDEFDEPWHDRVVAETKVNKACDNLIAKGKFNIDEPRKYPIVNLIEKLDGTAGLTFPSRYRLLQY